MSTTASIRNLGRAQVISYQAMMLGASQDAYELHMIVALMLDFAPRVMVEVGCDRGGTLFAWKTVCPRVYGITLEKNADSGGAACETHGADVLYGDSHADESRQWLLGKLDCDPVDVLVIDGDHFLEGVTADLADYGPLVRPGGLIMMHDVLHRRDFPCVQTWRLWDQVCGRYETEVIAGSRSTLGWGIIHVRPGDDFVNSCR